MQQIKGCPHWRGWSHFFKLNWLQDSGDPHARERALVVARQDPPAGVSPDEAVASIKDVLDSIGDTCPECQFGVE
jgi:hypothetical protein